MLEEESSTEDEPEPKPTKLSRKILPKFQEFREDTDMADPKFKLGMVFSSGAVFKNAIREYSIKACKELKFKVNDRNRVRAVCKDESCKWVCYASEMKDTKTFQIRTYVPKHTCARTNKNRFCTATWMSNKYLEEFKDMRADHLSSSS